MKSLRSIRKENERNVKKCLHPSKSKTLDTAQAQFS